MENKDKKKKDDWIRLASKSRPGRFYMFNKATGETQWLPLNEVGESEKQVSPPKLSINKSSKTPAQDRLKRLQHNLKTSKTREHTTRTTRHSKDLETKSKDQENQLKDQPSTSSSTKVTDKSPKKATKRPQSSSFPKEVEISVKSVKASSTLESVKKIRLSDSSTTSGKMATAETVTAANEPSKSLVTNNNPENLQNMDEDSSSTLSNIRTGIVKKIKEICKMPFNMSKKTIDEKSSVADNKSSSLINTTQFKPARKSNDNKKRLSSSAVQESINKLTEENVKTKNMKRKLNQSELGTPKNLNIPTYPRGSANSRLDRLKQSLLSQQQPCKSTNDPDTLHQTTKSSTEMNNNNNNTTLPQLEDNHQTGHNNSSLYQTANNTINDEVEAMDWQPIVKDEETIEITSSESSSFVIEKSNKLLLKTIDGNKNETMGDIYDTVNENLLRFSAEKFKDNNKKWQKDYYYFIVDTNVLLRDMSFLEDLTKMKLCDTKGSMLYVPYAVLQELDRLKMRSGLQEGVKTRAVRAIKYLNSKFENDSSHLQAQSALDERQRLVDINSADDSIINCCLQAKEHVRNLLLLTEDINLRNKAICNNILVSTKSDLMSKRYESSDTDDKS
ncbi:transcriptional protein SWT1 [Calliphora vicina]|uniref:transcriptional protein SWT1 n=1 Tax=Calliphora vicina TaxID=7373 RepID=UPI00325C2027